MNREIKFRAWDKPRKKFWEVFKLFFTDKVRIGALKNYPESSTMYDEDFVLMQFTGLLDKNGVEIFEGDIVQFKETEQEKESEFYYTKKTVIFNNGSFGFQEWYTDEQGRLTKELTHTSAYLTTPALYYQKFDIEVIGNIYENKNLLKGETK